MLENFGFRVIDERTYTVEPRPAAASASSTTWCSTSPAPSPPSFAARAPLIEAAILAVWQTEAESDGLNQLTLRRRARLARRRDPPRAGALSEAGRRHLVARLSGAGAEPPSRCRRGAGDAVPRPARPRLSPATASAPSPRRARRSPRRSRRRSRSTRTASSAACSTSSTPRCAPTPSSATATASARPALAHQVRLPPRSTACPSRGPTAKSSSIRRASRACICASAPSPAAACAGPTGPRISAPRCWGW